VGLVKGEIVIRRADLFPVGTAVRVYALPHPEAGVPLSAPPIGAIVEEATVAATGTLTFTSLPAGYYVAWASASAYLRFGIPTGAEEGYIPLEQKGTANGVGTLDGEGHLTLAQLPPSVVSSVSPAFTGSPTAPTQAEGDNSTKLATTQYSDRAANEAQEDAEAASDKAGAAASEQTRAEAAEALKAPLASPALTGTPTAPTAAELDKSTKLATTAYVDRASSAISITVPLSGDTTGAADTAALEAAAATLKGGGTITFRSGKYYLNNAVLGSEVSRKGLRLKLQGAGGGTAAGELSGTQLAVGSASTGRILTIKGPSDSTSAYLVFSDLMIGQEAETETTNYAYSAPLLQVIGYTNWRFERCTGRLNGTGTWLKLDSCFNGSWVQSNLVMGRYGVPLDFDDSAGGTPQMDTVLLQNVITTGCFGLISRNITNGLNKLRLDGYKTYIEAGADRNKRTIGKLAKTAEVGETTIELESAAGFAEGDPVIVGCNENLDPNKVMSIAGAVLTLAQPLRYKHDPTKELGFQGQVISHGFGLSVASNTQLLKLDSCHLEGSATGIILGEVQNVRIENCLGVNLDFVYAIGAVTDLKIDGLQAQGNKTGENEGTNNIITRPAANTAAMGRIIIARVSRSSGQPVPVYLNGEFKATVTDITENVGGVPVRTVNVPTGSEGKAFLNITVNGVSLYEGLYSSKTTLRGGGLLLQLIQSVAGSAVSPSINFEDTQEPAKHVSLGKSATAQLSIYDNSNTKQITFDASQLAVFFGSELDAGIRRSSAGILKAANTGGTLSSVLGANTDWDACGQSGLMVPQTHIAYTPTALAASAKTGYVMRFKTAREIKLKKVAFRLVKKSAAESNKIEVTIYGEKWERVATSGEVEKGLSVAEGIVTIALEATLLPGTVYYAGFAWGPVIEAGVQILGASFGSYEDAKYFGTTAGLIEYDSHSEFPMANPFVGGTSVTNVPILALRES
jgi:hypothetical protein